MRGCEKFAIGSKSRRLCESSNSFRDLHGIERIDGLDDAPIQAAVSPVSFGESAPVVVVSVSQPIARKGGGCCGGGRMENVANENILQTTGNGALSVSASKIHSSIQEGRETDDAKEESLAEKAKWLIGGAIGVAKASLGIDRAKDETIKLRWDICNACEKQALGECTACNCWVGAKIRISSQSCPLGLWGKE